MVVKKAEAKAFDIRAYHTACYILWNTSDSVLENSKATSILTDTKCYEGLSFLVNAKPLYYPGGDIPNFAVIMRTYNDE